MPKFPIEIKDSLNGSIGLGLITMSAAEAIKKKNDFNEVSKIVENAVENTTLFIGLKELNHVVKGGRISPKIKKVANFFRINPILTFNNKGIKPIGFTIGNNNKAEKFKRFVESKIPKNKNVRLGIAYAKMEEFALNWSKNLRKDYGKENVVLTEVGPALGVHAGPGSLVFAIQVLDNGKH